MAPHFNFHAIEQASIQTDKIRNEINTKVNSVLDAEGWQK